MSLHPAEFTAAAITFALVSICPAQDEPEAPDIGTILERVRNGGRFEDSVWHRGPDGALEMHFFADLGIPVPASEPRFRPLVESTLLRSMQNIGPIGFLALACPGPDDLVAMTDAEFHLGALGVDITDVGLRQYLARPAPSFEGDLGRSELFDRMLAIDLLERRGCRSATAELRLIANAELPEPLRTRAGRAMARLAGEPDPITRHRLDAETLDLPLVFDGAVIVDHARLPDMRWLTGFGQRLGALLVVRMIERAGGTVSPAMLNGSQQICDVVAEFPFEFARRLGNRRIDQSCIVVTAKNDRDLPVAVSWQAAGEFEAERWTGLDPSDADISNNPLLGGETSISATRLTATLGGGAGKPRPEIAAELLRDDAAAIRAVVPRTSKLWAILGFLDLPKAEQAQLRITFGDPAVIELDVTARDEDGAAEWVAVGEQRLPDLAKLVAQDLPPELADHDVVRKVVKALEAAKLLTATATAKARLELGGITPDAVRSFVQQLLMR